MRVRRLGAILLVLSSAGVVAQDPLDKPQFRAGVELIQLDVAVLADEAGGGSGAYRADLRGPVAVNRARTRLSRRILRVQMNSASPNNFA